jgi:hypothetical protein
LKGVGRLFFPVLLAAVGAATPQALAQETPSPVIPEAPSGPADSSVRPGLWRLGPLYLTPTFHVGNVGVDTNVLFQSEDRKRDFSVSGGPGLELVLPANNALRFRSTGQLDYLYFLEQADQRRLTGNAMAGLRWDGAAFLAGAEYDYTRTFSRFSPEVDDRVDQTQRGGRAELAVGGGPRRFGVSSVFSATRYEFDQGQLYLGSDLHAALSRDEYLAQLVLRYGITPKTALVLGGDYQWDRFLLRPERDADSNRAFVGFEISSATRLSGRAIGGVRSFRLRATDSSRLYGFAEVNLVYAVSGRTRLEGRYQRDLDYSAFVSTGTTPTLATESYGLVFQKGLVAQLDLRLSGSLSHLTSDGDVLLVLPDQGIVAAPRHDDLWQAGADLGYTFASRLRVGFAATYANRSSTVAYFGVRGLVMGATVVYSGTPNVTLRP